MNDDKTSKHTIIPGTDDDSWSVIVDWPDDAGFIYQLQGTVDWIGGNVATSNPPYVRKRIDQVLQQELEKAYKNGMAATSNEVPDFSKFIDYFNLLINEAIDYAAYKKFTGEK